MDDHAEYVRAEWRIFHERGAPLARLASRIAPSAVRALDVGCGAGQELLPYLGGTAVGVDLSMSGILAGRALFRESRLRVPALLLGAAEALPFATAAFDAVICRLALPYADVPRALAEMARVLRPGGALVLQIHSVRYYLRRALRARNLGELVHAARAITSGIAFELTGWQPGEVFLRVRTLSRLLADAGVEVMEIDGRDPTAPLVLGRRRQNPVVSSRS
jgi:2-polyprenyl-6-hydroxyphenyl methylase/3-demethylubiquinone-9 3-methyltransferase